MKDFFVNIVKDRVVISSNPNPVLTSYEDVMDINKRYLYKEGDKIVNPWGQIETIKEIIRDYSSQYGHEWIIMVEENGNQYKPCELNGILVREMSLETFKKLIKVEYLLFFPPYDEKTSILSLDLDVI